MSKNNLYNLSLFLPICIVLVMTFKPLFTTLIGEPIQLQTIPYDPRDLFYGDYVTLHFEIEEVPVSKIDDRLLEKADKIKHSSFPHKDPKVYILLEPDAEGVYHVDRVLGVKPFKGIYLTGTMNPYFYEDTVRLDIPFDRFYLEENTGLELERESIKGNLLVTIRTFQGYGIMQGVEVRTP